MAKRTFYAGSESGSVDSSRLVFIASQATHLPASFEVRMNFPRRRLRIFLLDRLAVF
jgi:hypothetical protein